MLKLAIGLIATLLAILVCFYVHYWFRELVLWRPFTERRLEENQAREPDNPALAVALAKFYLRHKCRSTGTIRQEQAQKAFAWYERAYQLTTNGQGKLLMLHRLATMACEAHDDEKAAAYATEVLRSTSQQPDFGVGSAIHDGNLVLGRLALRKGKIGDAKKHLLKSAQTPGGPGLDTAGPNMMLAKELLEQGETKTVLAYFALCAKFWKMDYGKLKQWEHQAQRGDIPDFGKQLDR